MANTLSQHVEDLGEHAAEKACRAIEDVLALAQSPTERMHIAMLGLCGVLGLTAGQVSIAFGGNVARESAVAVVLDRLNEWSKHADLGK